jgi:pimeloyl-ACP methyl ester carboxylesterase
MQPLADSGYDVIAVDYRGAGDSNHPAGGYDKMTMAKDVHTLYHDKLQIDKAIVLGTDIGSMVAVSLALQFEEDVLALITGGRLSLTGRSELMRTEAPIPGTNTFEDVCNDAKWSTLFHFGFHNCPDLPEALTKGRERIYIKHFWDRLVGLPF